MLHRTFNMTDGVHMGIGVYTEKSQEQMNSSSCGQKEVMSTRGTGWPDARHHLHFGCLTNATCDLHLLVSIYSPC